MITNHTETAKIIGFNDIDFKLSILIWVPIQNKPVNKHTSLINLRMPETSLEGLIRELRMVANKKKTTNKITVKYVHISKHVSLPKYRAMVCQNTAIT